MTSISTLGSHCALQVLKGAKDEGFKTILVCENKNKELGEWKCNSCILYAPSKGHRDWIEGDLIRKECGYDKPCAVLNYWNCPYNQDPKLFELEQLKYVLGMANYHFMKVNGYYGPVDITVKRIDIQPDEFYWKMGSDPEFYKKFIIEHWQGILQFVPEDYKEKVKEFIIFLYIRPRELKSKAV